MLTKDIDISEWSEDFDNKCNLIVKIRRITFGQFTKMTEQMINIKMVGKNQITTTSPERNQILTLLNGLAEAPFELTEKGILEIPSDLGSYLYDEIESFNSKGKREKNLKD